MVERNPPEGRQRAAGLYQTRPVTPTTSTPLYENASGLQPTPGTGSHLDYPLGTQSGVDDARSTGSTS